MKSFSLLKITIRSSCSKLKLANLHLSPRLRPTCSEKNCLDSKRFHVWQLVVFKCYWANLEWAGSHRNRCFVLAANILKTLQAVRSAAID